MNVHIGIIQSSLKIETTQMNINWRMDKQNVRHPHNRISFSHITE